MNPKRKAEIAKIVAHFRGKNTPVTNELLTEHCNLNKVEPITAGQYSDYLYQIENDEKMAAMLPIVLQLFVDHMSYVGEFGTEKEQQARIDGMNELRVKLVQLLEENNIPYHWAQKLYEEFGSQMKGVLDGAGQVASVKATEVMLHIAREKFGNEIHMGHVASYAREVFEKKEAEKKEEAEDVKVMTEEGGEELPKEVVDAEDVPK